MFVDKSVLEVDPKRGALRRTSLPVKPLACSPSGDLLACSWNHGDGIHVGVIDAASTMVVDWRGPRVFDFSFSPETNAFAAILHDPLRMAFAPLAHEPHAVPLPPNSEFSRLAWTADGNSLGLRPYEQCTTDSKDGVVCGRGETPGLAWRVRDGAPAEPKDLHWARVLAHGAEWLDDRLWANDGQSVLPEAVVPYAPLPPVGFVAPTSDRRVWLVYSGDCLEGPRPHTLRVPSSNHCRTSVWDLRHNRIWDVGERVDPLDHVDLITFKSNENQVLADTNTGRVLWHCMGKCAVSSDGLYGAEPWAASDNEQTGAPGRRFVRVVEIGSGRTVSKVPLGRNDEVDRVYLSPDHLTLAIQKTTQREQRDLTTLDLYDAQTGAYRVNVARPESVDHLAGFVNSQVFFSERPSRGWQRGDVQITYPAFSLFSASGRLVAQTKPIARQSDDGRFAFTVDTHGHAELVDLALPRVVTSICPGAKVIAFDWLPNGRARALCELTRRPHRRVFVWDGQQGSVGLVAEPGRLPEPVEEPQELDSVNASVAFSPDGAHFAVVARDEETGRVSVLNYTRAGAGGWRAAEYDLPRDANGEDLVLYSRSGCYALSDHALWRWATDDPSRANPTRFDLGDAEPRIEHQRLRRSGHAIARGPDGTTGLFSIDEGRVIVALADRTRSGGSRARAAYWVSPEKDLFALADPRAGLSLFRLSDRRELLLREAFVPGAPRSSPPRRDLSRPFATLDQASFARRYPTGLLASDSRHFYSGNPSVLSAFRYRVGPTPVTDPIRAGSERDPRYRPSLIDDFFAGR